MILRVLALASLLALLVGGAAAASETPICLAPNRAFSEPAAQTEACLALDAATAARAACASTDRSVCWWRAMSTDPGGRLVVVWQARSILAVLRAAERR